MATRQKSPTSLRVEYDRAPLASRIPPPVAAAGLGLSPLTLERWRSVGRGPKFSKLSSRVVYRKADVERWAAEVEGLIA